MTVLLGAAFSAPAVNSSIVNQTTSVPLAYRAIVLIVIIIVVALLAMRFLGMVIGAIIGLFILVLLVSTLYWFIQTGQFSIGYTFDFIGRLVSFFLHGNFNSLVGTVGNTISSHVGSAINGTIS